MQKAYTGKKKTPGKVWENGPLRSAVHGDTAHGAETQLHRCLGAGVCPAEVWPVSCHEQASLNAGPAAAVQLNINIFKNICGEDYLLFEFRNFCCIWIMFYASFHLGEVETLIFITVGSGIPG